jgi:hypothetical protein
MKCLDCGDVDLIHGGDHDCEEDEGYSIVSNLSCPVCNSLVIVYRGSLEGSDTLEGV